MQKHKAGFGLASSTEHSAGVLFPRGTKSLFKQENRAFHSSPQRSSLPHMPQRQIPNRRLCSHSWDITAPVRVFRCLIKNERLLTARLSIFPRPQLKDRKSSLWTVQAQHTDDAPEQHRPRPPPAMPRAGPAARCALGAVVPRLRPRGPSLVGPKGAAPAPGPVPSGPRCPGSQPRSSHPEMQRVLRRLLPA